MAKTQDKLRWGDLEEEEDYGGEDYHPREVIGPDENGIKRADVNNMAKTQDKLRWADLEEDDRGEDYLPRGVIGPDENGIKRVIEYRKNEDGKMVKVTTTIRIRKQETRLSKRAMERRSWAKFGEAVNNDVGNHLTMVSTEEISLERHRPLGSKEEISKAEDSLAKSAKQGAVLMVCRTCGRKGEHWTAQCPYKDLVPPTEDRPGSSDSTLTPSVNKGSSYVPPSKRGGAIAGSDIIRRRNDENSVRVGNLSEDTGDSDLYELFASFGQVQRAHVVKDFKTGLSRGYGFVNFLNRDDAQRAIDKLNGYGYDNLILEVSWSAPRSN